MNLELSELMPNLIYAGAMLWSLGVVPVMHRRGDTMGVCIWSPKLLSLPHSIPKKNIRYLCVRMPEVYAAFNKGQFSVQMGGVILLDETKLTRPLRASLVATLRREEATSYLVPILRQLRHGCWMTQDVVFTIGFFVSICLLLHPRPKSIRTWLQRALTKASKPW